MAERIIDRKRQQTMTRAERRPPPLRQSHAGRIFGGHGLAFPIFALVPAKAGPDRIPAFAGMSGHWIASAVPCPARQTNSFSRCVLASELCEPPRARKDRLPAHDPEQWRPAFGQDHAHKEGRRSADRRTSHEPRNVSAARQRLGREPLAFRRSAAALARANASAVGSAPVPAFPETRLDECYSLSPVSSLPSSSETGRHAGRAVAQSRPGAVCETARGHRTRSASRSHPECALR
jgi:hypothetical protein